jgi:segregation and condensation protein B
MHSSLKIVTTPMCEGIIKLAGISDYTVSKDPDSVEADIAIVLSETNLSTKSIKIKLNTFSQIKNSIEMLSEIFGTTPLDCKMKYIENSKKSENRKIKVRVHSNFLKEIVEDMGFKIVNDGYDFVVYPDYMEDKIINGIEDKIKVVEIPSHKNVPLSAIKRAEIRYNILEKKLCMKP